MEKLWNGESLRFYRIPFNTGDADRIRFVFLAFTQSYKVFPVKNFEEYAKLPDYDPEAGRFGWKFGPGFGPGFGGPGKDNDMSPDSVTVKKDESPELFDLIQVVKNSDPDRIKRLTAYYTMMTEGKERT